MTEDEELRKKILARLEKAGYPLEMRVAAKIREHGPFNVSQSQNYVDPVTNKIRETDVLASWVIDIEGHSSVSATYFYLVVECKSKPQPWVAFDGGIRTPPEEPEDNLLMTPHLYGGDGTNQLLLQSLINFEDTHTASTIFSPIEKGMSTAIVEISLRETSNSNETNKAWAAVQSATAAAHGLLEGSKKFLRAVSSHVGHVAIIYAPVVVTSGKLFRCWLNEQGNTDLKEIHRTEIAVRLSPELPLSRCIVVSEAGLGSLLAQLDATQNALLMTS
ncbi:hypothetical protein [Kribbella sp. VKM Ac-2566]|uniref:hypothetical protein n=1 Tax=Kribbella sp. VKM Ac-2566 TaxID=2512218 RepID=UPI0010630678|nr:hypothetical protein [Kribbella sp. VKM Ac-2566]TDW98056.1 hypothetical protein EV647_2751 [Kribbella sp. VKM Ac-2566]